jgi:hypothetical protein
MALLMKRQPCMGVRPQAARRVSVAVRATAPEAASEAGNIRRVAEAAVVATGALVLSGFAAPEALAARSGGRVSSARSGFAARKAAPSPVAA